MWGAWDRSGKKGTLEWKNIHMEISEFQQKKSSHPLINSSKLAIVGLPLFFPFFDGVVGLLY